MTDERDWRQYEEQIYQRLIKAAGGDEKATVTFDSSLPGRFSETDRQVDVLVHGSFARHVGEGTMAVDCKCFSKKVDVKAVETFIGLVDDVNTDFGLMVTTEGYTPAAEKRAAAARGMRVEIVPYDELADWRPEVHFCRICTDTESDKAPGPVYTDPFDLETAPRGAYLVRGVGRCWTCNAIHMECGCGTLNAAYDEDEGKWLACEGFCGVMWKVEVERDREGFGLTEDPTQEVEFKRASG